MTITLNPTEIQYEEDLYDQNSDQEMSEKDTAEEDVMEDHFVVDVLDSSPIITGQDSLIEDPHSKWLRFLLGISLAFISGLIFTGNNVVIQMLHCDYSDTLLIRSLVQVLVIGSICKIKGLSLWPKIGPNPTKLRALIVFQGIFGALLIILGFSCVLFMPLGDALTLIFSAPLSTMVTAAIFLKHRLRLFKITAGVILVIGTILVIKPPFIFNPDLDDINDTVERSSHNNNRSMVVTTFYSSLYHQDKHDSLYFIGVIIALSSAMADGFLNVAINFCKEVNSLVLLWWAGMGGLLVSFISSTFDDQESILHYSDIVNIGVEHWLAFFGMACVGIFSYFCMTKSLQMIDPTIVAFVRALEIVFAYIAQIAIMHQLPDSYAIIGGSCVLVSVLAMAIQTKITALIPEKIRFLF